MSESRVPPAPLPRPFLKVVEDTSVTREDFERTQKNLQQAIDNLERELKRERDLTKKLEKSGEVLQEILSAPDFKALSFKSASVQVAETAAAAVSRQGRPGGHVEEPPVEYVDVEEIVLTDAEVKKQETTASAPGK